MIDKKVLQQKNEFFLHLSPTKRGALVFAMLVGVGAFIAGMSTGHETRTWGSFLFNLLFFFSLALGGSAFGGMQDVISALWARPIKRIHESYSAFVPFAAVLLVLFFAAIQMKFLKADLVFNWIHDPHLLTHFPSKVVWLTPKFMMVRDLIAIGLIIVLIRWQRKLTLEGDHALLAGNEAEARRLGTANMTKLRYWSAPMLCLHSILYSLLIFDLTMSLAPTWFSTLWGGWAFAIMMQTLMALNLIVMFSLRNTPVGHFIGRSQFHDVGKLMFGFTVFFAYLTFAHILTYWYTNIPEETSYLITRLQFPWRYLVIACGFGAFLLPFAFFIPKASKWTRWVAVPTALLVLCSQWTVYLLVVIPEVTAPETWYVPWIEVGMLVGFLGLFLTAFFRAVSKHPILAISDPLLSEALHSHH